MVLSCKMSYLASPHMRTVLATLAVLISSICLSQSLERDSPSCASAAVEHAREEAARGDAASLYLMARYYSTGKCFPGDGSKAVDFYWKAAALNYPPAFYNLGVVAAGGEQDYAKAELMFFRGAQLGHRGAELQLGMLYQLAPPPTRDHVKAFAWLTVTSGRAEPISREAKTILERVNQDLVDDQRKRGLALATQLQERLGNVPAFAK